MKTKNRSGEIPIGNLVVVGLMLLALIVGMLVYNNHAKAVAEREQAALAAERARQEEKARLERERIAKEEAEFEEKRRQARLAKEEEEARQAAEEAERRRKKALAEEELRKKQEELRAAKIAYQGAQRAFAVRTALSRVTPDGRMPQPYARNSGLYCVFEDYPSTHLIYQLSISDCRVRSVSSLSPDALAAEEDVAVISKRLVREKHILSNGEVACFRTSNGLAGSYAIPEQVDEIRISVLHLGGLYDTAVALGMSFPAIGCRVSLQSDIKKANGCLGVFDYDAPVPLEKLEAIVASSISKSLKKRSSPVVKQIKKPSFRRTVVKYDGAYIKQDVRGVTFVPRQYRFMGTTNYKMRDYKAERTFREKWEALTAEAEAQEQREAEINAEYEAACAAAAAKERAEQAAISRASGDDAAIFEAMSKCKLLIEVDRAKGR